MVEKVIKLENVSLVDFLGVENTNIKEISNAFPKSKIISRGNEIRIQGSSPEILKINDTFNNLLEHYRKFGGSGHWLLVVGYEGEKQNPTSFLVNDPDVGGKLRVSRKGLESMAVADGQMWMVKQ